MPTRNIKPTYIGGTTSEARKKYFNLDKELTQIITNLAASYGISSALVIDRLAHEGIIDRLINDHNAHVQRGGKERASRTFSTNTFNSPYGLFGLDNIFDTYTKGITKTKRPINFKKMTTRNESGETVNSGETKNLYDTLELFTAELASRRNQVKQQYPNLTDTELDSATAARYNATNRYFKQLMDSGEYKTKYPIDVEGVNIPAPIKTDSKYIQNQSKELNLDKTFREMPYDEYIYDNKSWNPNLFLENNKVVNPDDKVVKGILEEYVKRNFSESEQVNFVQEYKCGGRRKAQLGLDIREGGIAIPIANNMWYIHGRKHEYGGVTMGPNNKNGVEVEGGEVVEMIDSNHPSVGRQFAAGGQNQTMRVFSSVPLLRGVSPAQLVMGGANPNTVFKAQEEFKNKNRINDDGTRYQNGGKKKYNSAIRTEDDKNVSIRNRAIYSAVDSTSDYPKWWQAIGLGIGSNIKAITNPDNMNYNVIDSVADAAWRKRLGLSYDNKFLIPNKDGSVRLPKNVEMEIPTDTTMLKRRIASNEQFANQNNIMGEDWKIVQAMIDKDKEALDALRTTYKTGKPVVINEYAHNSRNLSKNGELIKDAINYKSPLNVMKNYTIQYDPKNKSMNYWDTYDFNEFEWGVPGKPFEIKGNIPLKKVGGIYIKPSKRGTFTAAATKRGMGVQEFASKVLANKEDYSPTMVKKANFARNANRWKKEYGGNMIYTINGNVKNGLSLRPKAQYGKQTIIRNNKEWEYDEKSGAFVPVKYVTKYKTIAGRTYKKEPNSKNYVEVTDSVEKAKLNKPKEAIVKQNNKSESNKESPAKENKYVSTTKSNTGESYIINPLTGEWIRNGVTETSEPSVKGTTKVTSKSSSTPRGRGTKASTPKAAVKTTTKGADVKYGTPLKEKKESLYITGIKNNSITPLRAGMEKIKSPSSTEGGTQSKEAPWVPQYNLITGRDWLGVGTNLAGHIASYFANNSLLKKAPMPTKPVLFQAAKLKTTHNINPKLANIDEVTQMNLAEVGRNTSSSSTNLARKQRIMNEARDARNKLYGQKENIETQLINLDRRNRQDVYNRNIAAYNDWLDKTYVAKSNNLLNKQRNLTNLISGIPMAVNTMLGTIESRKSTNDMIQAISASRPNVDGRLLGIGDYYSQKLPDGRTAIYNKNHKLVKYV